MGAKTPASPRLPRRPRISWKEVGGFGLVVLLMLFCVKHQRDFYRDWWAGSGKYVQRVNIPKPEVIRVASLNYQNLVADYLTLRAVQMFGAAWETPDESNEPIFQYFDVLTTLDPHFLEVYEFANLVLSDGRGAHDLALDILRKGIRENSDRPEAWRLPYLGMYTALWNLDDPDKAREFLKYANEIPDTPEHVLRMEEYIERKAGRFIAAFEVNLRQLLRYTDNSAKVEVDLAWMKFNTILDEWYKYELATAIEAFLAAEGRHPASMEELLLSRHCPSFRAPTLASVEAAINRRLEQLERGSLEDQAEQILEECQVDVVGLPPDPWGTWYFLSSHALSEVESGALPISKDAPLQQRYPYLVSMNDRLLLVRDRTVAVKRRIYEAITEDGKAPGDAEMVNDLGWDQCGGHYIYDSQARNESGTLDPVFTSTSLLRHDEGRDPRRGLTGTLRNYPARILPARPGEAPWLPSEPTIWDFPEDAEWALGFGLQPGVPFWNQPAELQEFVRSGLWAATVPIPLGDAPAEP